MSKLKPDPSKIINRLGGTVKTSKLCGVTKGAVSQWRNNGIPSSWLRFLLLARPDVFDDCNLIDIDKSAAASSPQPA